MPGQNVADLLDRVENCFGQPALFEQFSHSCAHLLPEGVAAFLMHALIAYDGELPCARHEVNQDRVAMPGLAHAHLEKPFLREGKRVRSLALRNIDPYFAGAFAFGLGNRADDLSLVQLTDKYLRIHGASPTPARASSTRSEEHTSELQSLTNLVCRLLLEKKNELESTARGAWTNARTAQQIIPTRTLRNWRTRPSTD